MQIAAEIVALVTLAGAPLALGAVHLAVALSVAVLGCVSLLLLVLGNRGHRIRTSWLAPVLLVIATTMALQLIPLPPSLAGAIAPANHEIYTAAGVDGWHPITLDAAATARKFARGLGWIAIFLVLQHRSTESKSARRRVLRAVAGSATAAALIGFGHLLGGEKQTLFGLYTFAGPKTFLSTLGNANHLSGFLNLGGLVALGLAAHAQKRERRIGWALAFLGCAAGSVLTASRGGTMALVAGLVLLPVLGIDSRERKASGERDEGWRSWATIAGSIVAACVAAWWIYDQLPRLLREMATVFQFDVEAEEGKLQAYKIAIDAVRAHPFLGIGRGAFETVQALYVSKPWGITFTHAENEPLQALAELGIPVGALWVGGIAIAWLGLVRRGRYSWAEAGAAAGGFALLLQNLVDFSMQYAPGLALISLLAYRPKREVRLPSAPLAAVVPVLVGIGSVHAFPDLKTDTDRLLALGEHASLPEVDAAARDVWARRPAWYLPADVAATRALAVKDTGAALKWTNELLRLQPEAGRGHLLAAEAFAQRGVKKQAIAEYRRAAALRTPTIERVIARWPDPAVLLDAVPSDADATLQALWPLEKAGFRGVAIDAAERALVTTPEEPRILGRLYWLRMAEKQYDQALTLAQRLRKAEPEKAAHVALEARTLVALGRRDEARALYDEAEKLDHQDQNTIFWRAELELEDKKPDAALQVLDRLALTAGDGAQANRHWLRARALRALGQQLKARDELRLALRRSPTNKWYAITLADVLLDLNQLDEAAKTLEPLAEDPSANNVRTKLEKLRADAGARQEELQRARIIREADALPR